MLQGAAGLPRPSLMELQDLDPNLAIGRELRAHDMCGLLGFALVEIDLFAFKAPARHNRVEPQALIIAQTAQARFEVFLLDDADAILALTLVAERVEHHDSPRGIFGGGPLRIRGEARLDIEVVLIILLFSSRVDPCGHSRVC